MDVVLWHFPVSHYNEKVRWALDWKGIAHERKVLAADYLPRALLATGKPTLPILFLNGKAITDSTAIIEALEAAVPAPALYPPDRTDCRRALELENFLDEELGSPVRTALVGWAFYAEPEMAVRVLSTGMSSSARSLITRMLPVFRPFYTWRHGIRRDNVDAARAAVHQCLDRIEGEIQPSGYLAGDRFSIADLTAASLLAPILQPKGMEFPADEGAAASFASYRETVVGHPAAQWATGIFERHRNAAANATASHP